MAYQADGDSIIHYRLSKAQNLTDDDLARIHPKFIEKYTKADGRQHVRVKQYKEIGLPHRGQNYNTQGKKVLVEVNQFKVESWPQQNVAQFDIKVTPASGNIEDAKKVTDGTIKKVWNAPVVQEYREKYYNKMWIFDGKKIAWNTVHMKRGRDGRQEHTIRVNLDPPGRIPRANNDLSNVFNITFRQTTEIKMATVGAFLKGQMDFTNDVYEAINFLDHVLRETPSQKYTQVKRSFFTWDATLGKQELLNTMYIDNTIEFMRGVYSSVRLCHRSNVSSTGLAVNLDVANGLFWAQSTLDSLAVAWCANALGRGARVDQVALARDCLPVIDHTKPYGTYKWSDHFRELRKFLKLKIVLRHKGKTEGLNGQVYTIKRFVMEPYQLNKDGANSKNTMFEWKDKVKHTSKMISVYDYMRERYNQQIKYWQLPLVETMKGGLFPMEYCIVIPKQRFPFKTDPNQTARMIKFAVQRPKQRLEAIAHGIRMLEWDKDEYLKHYNIKIDMKMTTTEARLLPNPQLQFTQKIINPGLMGRWNIQGVKFLRPNPRPLVSWGVCALDRCVDVPTIQNFITTFVGIYASHGGNIQSSKPYIMVHNKDEEIPHAAERLRRETGNKFNCAPQILVWILPDGNSETYGRMKRNMDCRYGLVSQMMRKEHVIKGNHQYCSNVCMKFNAKLGGTTSRVAGTEKDGSYNWFPKYRTMIIGADLTHPAHGSPQASMAAMTMSADRSCTRYWAMCQSNGYGVEMITPENIQFCMMRLFPRWISDVGGGQCPQHIYYFRDGVSEGQYAQVIEEEVAGMKNALMKAYPTVKVYFTVIVCAKRHKIRFFPKDGSAGDKNGNPHPGVLVERDVTHPHEHDFYLNSHSAIQGTARPTHYHVLMNEPEVPVNVLHKMIYEHCYQFIRSTTPVSLYPAVYYAHLAAARSRAHENVNERHFLRYGQKFEEKYADDTYAKEMRREHGISEKPWFKMSVVEKIEVAQAKQDELDEEAPALQPLPKEIAHTMWYI